MTKDARKDDPKYARKPDEPRPTRLGSDPFDDLDEMIEAARCPDEETVMRMAISLPSRSVERPPGSRDEPAAGRGITVACPHVGIVDDPHTRYLEPDPSHYCFAGRRPRPIMVSYQQVYCLSPDYPTCEIYQAAVAAAEQAPTADAPPAGGLMAFLRRLFGRRER